MPLDQGADTLADDEVVVGQEDRDRAGAARVRRPSPLVLAHRARRTGGDPPGNGGARHTLRTPVTTLVTRIRPVEAGPMTTDTLIRHEGSSPRCRGSPPRRSRAPAPGLRLRDHALRPAAARPRAWTWRRCGTRTASASPTCSAPSSRRRTGRIIDCGYLGGGLMGSTMVSLGAVQAPLPGGAAARHPTRARARRRLGPLRPDVRWPHRGPGAPAGPAPALRPVAGTARVDDAVPDPARRRARRARARRRQPVPAPLGLRRRQPALAQVRA